MSSYLFPMLAGVEFNYLRYYLWNTLVQESGTFKKSAVNLSAFPVVHFEYSWDVLSDSGASLGAVPTYGLQQMVGLINAVNGRYDTFLHRDPDFNAVTLAQFGEGDGATTAFQLTALYQGPSGPGAAELIQNVDYGTSTPQIYVGGSLVSSATYTISATGLVTFTTAPAVSAAVAATLNFFYRCRFDEGHYDFTKTMKGLWKVGKIAFTSEPL